MRLIDADELLTAFPVDDEPTLTKSCVRVTIQHMPTVDAVPSAQPERQETTELENKQTICELLLRTLTCTRALEDLDKITYDDKTENVTVRFRGGGQRMINVTADSGVAMIRDILRNIGV